MGTAATTASSDADADASTGTGTDAGYTGSSRYTRYLKRENGSVRKRKVRCAALGYSILLKPILLGF